MPRAFSSGKPIGVHAGERFDQRGLAVVDVTCGADDHGSDVSGTRRMRSAATCHRPEDHRSFAHRLMDPARAGGMTRRLQTAVHPCASSNPASWSDEGGLVFEAAQIQPQRAFRHPPDHRDWKLAQASPPAILSAAAAISALGRGRDDERDAGQQIDRQRAAADLALAVAQARPRLRRRAHAAPARAAAPRASQIRLACA